MTVANVDITVAGITTADKVLSAMVQGAPSSAGVVIGGGILSGGQHGAAGLLEPIGGNRGLCRARSDF